MKDWPLLASRAIAEARAWRPLAVLVGPPGAVAAAQEEDAAGALRVLGSALRVNWLPAVTSEPLPAERPTATAGAGETLLAVAVRAAPACGHAG